ncbi:MAG: glutamine-hydrolyzing carbamoyl-phosphate synthase small subunit, partial [Candidatus Nezhaarchaeota archaeon]|nr:glutamine-hydrolyzing carbamoyl-phosphate synthase small subunit [Candidatus Nezhaarchaeota archaeon]
MVLEDGTILRGYGFGQPGLVTGEVVFNTGMVGYPEALTDPSYRGQILCFTYPLIGNYGVPSYNDVDEYGIPLHFESTQIQVRGVVIHELCQEPSHWASKKAFSDWLREEGVPGVAGIDTRALTKRLREAGVMMGALHVAEEPSPEECFRALERTPHYDEVDYVKEVTVKEPVEHQGPGPKVAVIDCGIKAGILRALVSRGFSVVRLPYTASADEVLSYEPKGVLISNGPGNPARCEATVEVVRELFNAGLPMLGICLGNQLISLALGGRTYKLKYGHRGQNKPCIDLDTGLCYVTSQNHGYAVDPSLLKDQPGETPPSGSEPSGKPSGGIEGLGAPDRLQLAEPPFGEG